MGKVREMMKDREAWHVVIHGVAKSWTQLGSLTELNGRKSEGKTLQSSLVGVKISYLGKFCKNM